MVVVEDVEFVGAVVVLAVASEVLAAAAAAEV